MADPMRAHEEAVKKIGRTPREQMHVWASSYAFHDFMTWKTLTDELGRGEGSRLFTKIWENIAVWSTETALEGLKPEEADIPTLGEIARRGWDAIAAPYVYVKNNRDEHVGEVLICPFREFNEGLRTQVGDEVMDEYWQLTAETSDRYFKAMVEASGLGDSVEGGMDKFICTGDDVCRVFFRKRPK